MTEYFDLAEMFFWGELPDQSEVHGIVRGKLNEEFLVVQLYSWATGTEVSEEGHTPLEIMPIALMLSFKFFRTREELDRWNALGGGGGQGGGDGGPGGKSNEDVVKVVRLFKGPDRLQ